MASEAESRRGTAVRGDPTAGPWRWVHYGFFFLLPLQAVLASKSVVVLLLATALLALIGAWRARARPPWAGLDRGLALGLGGLLLWCALASLWTFDPSRSLLLCLRIGLLFAAALLLHAVVREVRDAAVRRRFGLALAAGYGIGLGLMVAELAFGFPLGHAIRGAEELGSDPAVWLNRGATAFAILCWPAAFVLWREKSGWAAAALLLAVLGALSLLSSLAAIVGVSAGCLVAVFAFRFPKAARHLLAAATLAAVIASPVLGQVSYRLEWQSASWLPFSAQHRVEIWHFTAERFAERPLAGWGFDSARAMKRLAAGLEETGRSAVALHPHNAPLQIMLELGLVGAALALGLAWLLIRRLEALPAPGRAFAQAAYASTLVIACTAFGMWQNQWLALMACAAIAISATSAGPREQAAGGD